MLKKFLLFFLFSFNFLYCGEQTFLLINALKNHPDIHSLHILEISNNSDLSLCKKLLKEVDVSRYTFVDSKKAISSLKGKLTENETQKVNFLSFETLPFNTIYDVIIVQQASYHLIDNKNLKLLLDLIEKSSFGYLSCSNDFISGEDLLLQFYHQGKKGTLISEDVGLTHFAISWQRERDSSFFAKENLISPRFDDLQKGCAIYYMPNDCRMGDNLINYLHARWISYKYGIPLLYSPFIYSDKFSLNDMDFPYSSKLHFKNHVIVTDESIIDSKASSTLYFVPYFPESSREYGIDCTHLFSVDWDDVGFKREIAKCLSPKDPVHLVPCFSDRINVAVHVRRRDNFDPSSATKDFALKFPTDDYYITEMKLFAKIFKDQPIRFFIFTDDLNPKELVKKYQIAVNNSSCEFSCREKELGPNNHVLDDFFSLATFDALILCQSNFSIAASKLGQYALKITPLSYTFKRGHTQYPRLEICFDGSKKLSAFRK